ncbi:MAG: hypothetical protein CME71_04700 [Halobacteriovorax sp.]|nr:hypothetical protein [Halobacteriovorax sp.]
MMNITTSMKLLTIVALAHVASCAHHSEPKVVTETQSEKPVDEKALKAQVESQLSAMAEQAKKAGPKAIEFLSSDLFLKANDAALRDDAQTASLLLKYVHQMNPDDLYVHKRYAVELIRSGELLAAEPHLKHLYKVSKGKEEALGLVLGGIYTALDRSDDAKKAYSEVLAKNAKNEEACLFLAKAHAVAKEASKAKQLLVKCQKANPKNAVFTYYLGKIALDDKKPKQALSYFNKALKLQPSFHQAAVALGVFHEEGEDFKSAIKVYRDFLKVKPSNYQVLSRLVQVMFATSQYRDVLPYAERLSSLDPDNLNLKVRLGILYTDSGKLDQAIGTFKEILVAIPDSDKVLFYLGSLYKDSHQYDDAMATFQQIPPDSALFHESALQVTQMLNVVALENAAKGVVEPEKQMKEQIDTYVAKHEEAKVGMHLVLASFYETLGKVDSAIESLAKVRNGKGFDKTHELYFASLLDRAKRHDEAISLVEKMLDKDPQDAYALNFIGYTLVEQGKDMDRAYSLIKKAIEIAPKDGYIRDTLGWYYYKIGNNEKALAELHKAVKLVSDDPVITKHLATVYRELESFELAKKYYVEALKLSKVKNDKDEVIKALEDLEAVRLPASKQ